MKITDIAHTFDFVLHFVRCVSVTVSPNQTIAINILITIIEHIKVH